MAHVYLQGLLFLLVLLKVVSASKVDSTVTDAVSAHKGEDAHVPCFNSTVMDPKSCYRVRLVKHDTDASQIVMFAWPNKNQDAKRVKWSRDGIESLHLMNVTKSDEGLYSCEVCQGWECTLVKYISLKVKDCKALKAMKAKLSTDIQLNCSFESVSGAENISWSMLKGGMHVQNKRAEMNGSSLLIKSLNSNDSGWYRCQYLSGQTQRCFEINLLVQDRTDMKNVSAIVVPAITTQQALSASHSAATEHMNLNESSGTLTAVVASVITAIVITAALIGLFFYCRHNTQTVTQQPQRYPAGVVRLSDDCYEIVDLPDEPSVQIVNSLYHNNAESLCTFQR